ncbi:MAG: M20/M25/M40 family metallo-hydrolase, partial [Candidatus Avoscillospira sp.]
MKETIKQTAAAYAAASLEEAKALLRTLGRIPAPSHQEDQRAAFCRDWFLAQGAEDVAIDDQKNVILKLGPQDGDLTVFQAHTDVVFPDLEPLSMREEDGRLYAPGIGDDTANLVNLMLAARYFLREKKTPKNGFLIVANSCEEGLGNLDGTKAVFAAYGDRIKAFYSFDCYLPECCDGAVGSWRYQITCKTQGGHS